MWACSKKSWRLEAAAGKAGLVNVYDALNGSGKLLASRTLAVNINDCLDRNKLFCNVDQVELLFGGPNGWLAFDDVTLGALDAGPAPVPEPASLALCALGQAQ